MINTFIAFAIAAAPLSSQASNSAPMTKQDTRYVEGLQTSFRNFYADTARFISLVNGTYAPKPAAQVKELGVLLKDLQAENNAVQALSPPARAQDSHLCLTKGCAMIVEGAGIFYGLYSEKQQPKKAQAALAKASNLFVAGNQELSKANAALSALWKHGKVKPSQKPL